MALNGFIWRKKLQKHYKAGYIKVLSLRQIESLSLRKLGKDVCLIKKQEMVCEFLFIYFFLLSFFLLFFYCLSSFIQGSKKKCLLTFFEHTWFFVFVWGHFFCTIFCFVLIYVRYGQTIPCFSKGKSIESWRVVRPKKHKN